MSCNQPTYVCGTCGKPMGSRLGYEGASSIPNIYCVPSCYCKFHPMLKTDWDKEIFRRAGLLM